MQTAPAAMLSHQHLVSRAQDTARAIERLIAQLPPAVNLKKVNESTREATQEVMGKVFEPFCHAFMSPLDVDIDNLRAFMLAVYDGRKAIQDIFEQAVTLQQDARYQRLPYTKRVVRELVHS